MVDFETLGEAKGVLSNKINLTNVQLQCIAEWLCVIEHGNPHLNLHKLKPDF